MPHHDPYIGPLYWLWVFDPQDGKVHITHNEDRPAAQHVTHGEFASEVTHPAQVRGFAYKIQGGFRITDLDSKKVNDPNITERVRKALKDEQAKPEPHPRHHGMP